MTKTVTLETGHNIQLYIRGIGVMVVAMICFFGLLDVAGKGNIVHLKKTLAPKNNNQPRRQVNNVPSILFNTFRPSSTMTYVRHKAPNYTFFRYDNKTLQTIKKYDPRSYNGPVSFWNLKPSMFPQTTIEDVANVYLEGYTGNSSELPTSFNRPPRYISCERIRPQYGLTNQLIIYVTMMSYGYHDSRDVVIPVESALAGNKLFDMNLINYELVDLKIRMVTHEEVPANIHPARMKKKIPLPAIHDSNTLDEDVKARVWNFIQYGFAATKNVPYVVQGDFFLRWPFGLKSTGPVHDLCYYMSRIHFAPELREIASQIVRATNAKRLLSVHLRLEIDALYLNKGVANVTTQTLYKHFTDNIIPLAKSLEIDAIYITSDKLEQKFMAAFDMVREIFPIHTRTSLNITVPELRTKFYASSMTTNHLGAAIDTMILEASTAAIVTGFSSLALSVYARVCRRNGNGIFLHSIRGDGTFYKLIFNPCDRPIMLKCNPLGTGRHPQYTDYHDFKFT